MDDRTGKRLVEELLESLAARDNPPQPAGIRLLTEHLPGKEAKAHLIAFLRRYPLHWPDLGTGPVEYWPDAWRSESYKALFETLCEPEEAFELAQAMALQEGDPERQTEALEALIRHFDDKDRVFDLLKSLADDSLDLLACELILRHFPEREASRPYIARVAVYNYKSRAEDARRVLKTYDRKRTPVPKGEPQSS